MKKKYIPPTVCVHVIASAGHLLQSSVVFDGFMEEPQIIDFLDDEIITSEDIG